MFAIQLVDKYYEKKDKKNGKLNEKPGEHEAHCYKSISPTTKKVSPKKSNKLESMFKGLTMMKSKSK